MSGMSFVESLDICYLSLWHNAATKGRPQPGEQRIERYMRWILLPCASQQAVLLPNLKVSVEIYVC